MIEVLVAVAALGTIAYYGMTAIEKWHDTIVSIDMSGDVDQGKPFTLPLIIKNPSSIFDMHYPSVSCKFSATYTDGAAHTVTENGGTYALHQIPMIAAGGYAPFFCDFPDKFKIASVEDKQQIPLADGNMIVAVSYETWLPWTLTRKPLPAVFNLLKTSTAFRWIKGDQIK